MSIKKYICHLRNSFYKILDWIGYALYEIFCVGEIERKIYFKLRDSMEDDDEIKKIIKEESYVCRFCENAYECYGHRRRKIGSEYCIKGVKEWIKEEEKTK